MYVGVDVGGSKTLVAVFDARGQVQDKVKFPTPAAYEDFLSELAKVVDNFSTKDFKAVGLALPAVLDHDRGLALAFGNLSWGQVSAQADAEKIFNAPVIIENDAKLAGLSEAKLLKEKYHKVLYVTISTGIGTGLITDGQIDPDFNDSEGGHILLEHGGKLQRWEEFASGKAITAKFGKPASEITDTKAWYLIARNIALGLVSLIATLTPDVIIIGGGVGSHYEKFKNPLLEALKIYETPLTPTPPIKPAVRAEEAVIYGCYELLRKRYGHH